MANSTVNSVILDWIVDAIDDDVRFTVHCDPGYEGVIVPDGMQQYQQASVELDPSEVGADLEGLRANVRIGDEVHEIEIPFEAVTLLVRQTSR